MWSFFLRKPFQVASERVVRETAVKETAMKETAGKETAVKSRVVQGTAWIFSPSLISLTLNAFLFRNFLRKSSVFRNNGISVIHGFTIAPE